MSNSTKVPKLMTLRTDEQRRAITSPQRMELLGLFTERKALSVSDIAERMGRPASAIHYHVGVLVKAGLLVRAGERHESRRPEALYHPAAERFALEQERPAEGVDTSAAIKTMATAFRMAEGDMKAALQDPKVKSKGPYRNILGARLHCRLSKEKLAELNRHLKAIEKLLSIPPKSHKPSADDQFISLTLALAPLRNREVPS